MFCCALFLEVRYEEFLCEWAKQYPNTSWHTIETRMHQMLAELFFVSSNAPTQTKGLRARAYTFAVYGVDVLVDADMQVHLLEVNFAPNCARLQAYHDFFGDLFDLLFFCKNERSMFTRLL